MISDCKQDNLWIQINKERVNININTNTNTNQKNQNNIKRVENINEII